MPITKPVKKAPEPAIPTYVFPPWIHLGREFETSMSANIYGDRIRQARHLRRMNSKDLAAALTWTPTRQTRNEQSDLLLVSDTEVSSLASVLRFPVQFFETSPAPKLSTTGLLYRAPKSTTVREKDFLVGFGRLVADLARFLDNKHRLPGVSLPTIQEAGTSPILAAGVVRRKLGAAEGHPLGYLTHALETVGVPVVTRRAPLGTGDDIDDSPGPEKDTSDRHIGSSGWFGDFGDRPIIMSRDQQSWERARLTLAHEVGHLVLHKYDVPADAEEQAFRFAAELLAPAEVIANEVPRYPTLNNLLPLKLKWGISIGALIRHLHESHLIDDRQFRRLQAQLYSRVNADTGKTWGATEPGWNDRQVELPRMLSVWIERCLGATSPQELAAITQLWPADLLWEMLASQRARPVDKTNTHKKSPRHMNADVVDFTELRKARRGNRQA